MASEAITASLFDAGTIADRWLAEYCGDRPHGDVLCTAPPGDRDAWRVVLEELAAAGGEALDETRERVQRHAGDIGTGFRVAGEPAERRWPLSPVPLLIGQREWARIADGIAQRAELIETVIADIYGPGRLVAQGHIPAALVTGSPHFLRPMVGLAPPGLKPLDHGHDRRRLADAPGMEIADADDRDGRLPALGPHAPRRRRAIEPAQRRQSHRAPAARLP